MCGSALGRGPLVRKGGQRLAGHGVQHHGQRGRPHRQPCREPTESRSGPRSRPVTLQATPGLLRGQGHRGGVGDRRQEEGPGGRRREAEQEQQQMQSHEGGKQRSPPLGAEVG